MSPVGFYRHIVASSALRVRKNWGRFWSGNNSPEAGEKEKKEKKMQNAADSRGTKCKSTGNTESTKYKNKYISENRQWGMRQCGTNQFEDRAGRHCHLPSHGFLYCKLKNVVFCRFEDIFTSNLNSWTKTAFQICTHTSCKDLYQWLCLRMPSLSYITSVAFLSLKAGID